MTDPRLCSTCHERPVTGQQYYCGKCRWAKYQSGDWKRPVPTEEQKSRYAQMTRDWNHSDEGKAMKARYKADHRPWLVANLSEEALANQRARMVRYRKKLKLSKILPTTDQDVDDFLAALERDQSR